MATVRAAVGCSGSSRSSSSSSSSNSNCHPALQVAGPGILRYGVPGMFYVVSCDSVPCV